MDRIEVPKHLKISKCLEWNTKYDRYNFLYILIRHFFKETSSIKNYSKIPSKYFRKFNLKGFSFPLSVGDINKFLRKNDHLPVTISIICEGEGEVTNLGKFSNEKEETKPLQLLLIKHDPDATSTDRLFCVRAKNCSYQRELEYNRQQQRQLDADYDVDSNFPSKIQNLRQLKQQHHFFKISNLRGFLNSRARLLSEKKYIRKYYYCEKCFLQFHAKNKKDNHEKICGDKQRTLYPEKGAALSFSNQKNRFTAPVLGFCDFESVLQRVKERSFCKACSKMECMCSFATSDDINTHRAAGYSILFVDSEDTVFLQDEYVGEDAVKQFFDRLPHYQEEVEKRKQKFRSVKKIKATKEEWKSYQEAEVCHICERTFIPHVQNYRKVPDHDHLTGKMVGAAHSLCNLARSGPFHTPIFFHNAQG